LTSELSASGQATIEIADRSYVGTIVRGSTVYGRSRYRIVAGQGGWGGSVEARSYYDTAGVEAAKILADLASDAGETIAGLPTTRLGQHYARHGGIASRVLHELAPRAWYVDAAGVTQYGQRASATYTGSDTRTAVDPAAGYVDLAVSELGVLDPGVVVDGGAPATDIEITLDATRLTVRVYRGTTHSRELDALARLMDSLDPNRRFHAVYEYRVVTQDGYALNLQPVRASSGMPDLERVPVRLPPGYRCEHLLGSLVTVAFLDGDASRPRVITGDDAGAPGWTPDEIRIEATDHVRIVSDDITLDAGDDIAIDAGDAVDVDGASVDIDASGDVTIDGANVDIDAGAIGSVTVGNGALSTELGPSPRLGVARQNDPVLCGGFAGVITLASLKVKSG
jgi:hypothetical protein